MNYLTLNGRNWSPLTDLRREMDRLFDDFWIPPNSGRSPQEVGAHWSPACDVSEDDDHYMITLEVAGIPKDQIQVEFQDNQILISGERRHESKSKEKSHWYTERRFGKFQRAFTMPTGIDSERVEANYQDGVLRVFIPKAESSKPRQIKISNGTDSSFFGRLLGHSTTTDKAAS